MTVPLPTGKFSVIYADPPWSFRSWSDKGRNRCPDALVRQKGLAERHYKVMSLDDIKALPVGNIAAEDSALFLWTVDCHLPEALAIGETWGFRFKTTSFTWCKTTQSGGWHIGLGYWTRHHGHYRVVCIGTGNVAFGEICDWTIDDVEAMVNLLSLTEFLHARSREAYPRTMLHAR